MRERKNYFHINFHRQTKTITLILTFDYKSEEEKTMHRSHLSDQHRKKTRSKYEKMRGFQDLFFWDLFFPQELFIR